MVKIPSLEQVTEVARGYIEHDPLVKKSVMEGYISRKEYEIYTFLKIYLIANSSVEQVQMPDCGLAEVLPGALEAAVSVYHMNKSELQEIYERGRNARDRIRQRGHQ